MNLLARNQIGIVVGLEAEARIARPLARRLGAAIAVGGGGREGAQRAAEGLVAGGARALISFGLAGGLDPQLRPGAIVIPAAIITGGHRIACDTQLSAKLGGIGRDTVYGGATILAEAAAKSRLRALSGAAAVDLESGAVASVASRRNLPCAALRAICDPAERDLPRAAIVALNAQGRIGLIRVAASVMRHPGQIRALIRLAGDARAARGALLRAVRPEL